ncbi:hypothetical protein CHARACLAT_013360 [Characodon lateralis]|uniref:Uncharacterized protein n=1 Tax=Characodon lateralis TaxID=208331 RepID=A0ABU7D8Q8_9TELE|nr:hypothetical protein [Characodon lateralis]
MLGKQLIQNNLFEIGIPKLKKLVRKRKSELTSKQEEELNKTLKCYEKDHFLGPFVGISPEYMEMSPYIRGQNAQQLFLDDELTNLLLGKLVQLGPSSVKTFKGLVGFCGSFTRRYTCCSVLLCVHLW